MLLYSLLLLITLGSVWLLPGQELSRLLVGLWLWPLNGWGLQRWLLDKGESDLLSRLGLALALPWGLYALIEIPAGALGRAPLPFTLAAALPGIIALFVFGRGEVWPKLERPSKTTAWALSAALLLTLLCFFAPEQLDLKSDVYAHISAIRACVEEARIFPVHEFYPVAQGLGADPRFGVLHSTLASWCQLSHSTPLQIWHSSLFFALPLFVLGTALLARSATRGLLAMIAAHLAFLGAFAGSFYNPLLLSAYPLWQALSILWVVFALYFSSSSPPWSQRRLHFVFALALIGALGLHALAYILGAAMLVALYFVVPKEERTVTAKNVGLILVISLPFLLLRFLTAYGDVNPIHHRPYFLMQWAPGLLSASPGFLSSWLFPFGILGILLALLQLRRMRSQPIQLWALLMGTVAVLWLTLPFLLTPSMKLLGFLPMRFTLLILFPLPIGLAVDRLGDPGSSRLKNILAGLLILGLALSTVQRVRAAYEHHPTPLVEGAEWTGLAAYCREHLDASAVVLSDPFSMIALRATAPVSIVALPDGRSSPRDRHAVERLRDSFRAMSPLVGGEATGTVLRRYGVTHVLVNQLFSHDLHSHEYPVDLRSFAAQEQKFSDNPSRFERVWGQAGLELFSVSSTKGEWNEDYLRPGPLPRPASLDAGNGLALADSFVLSRAALEQGTDRHARWFGLTGDLSYAGTAPPQERSFVIRADFVPNPVPSGLRFVEKPLRKLLEVLHGRRYRLRWTRYPGDPACPVYLLNQENYLPVSLKIHLPPSIPPGRYRVSLQLSKDSEFTVLSPEDYFQDEDVFQGPTVGEFSIE